MGFTKLSNWLIALVLCGVAFAQSGTKLITPVIIRPKTDDSATGRLCISELRASPGTDNVICLTVPTSIASDRTVTLQDSNHTLAGIDIAQTFTQNQTFSEHILTTTVGTKDIGSSTNYWQTIYGKNLDMAPSGIASNYTKVRKLEIVDTSGGTNFWDIQVSQAGSVSSFMYIRDNAGANVLQLNRVIASSTVNTAALDMHWKPTVNNQWDLGDGTTPLRWRKAWVVDLDVSGTCTGCGGGGLPVVDTTAVVKGSVDDTKLLRFEVDGLTTATTRVLTPQDNDYTIAGINIAQTFTQNQSFSEHILATTVGTKDIGSSSNYWQTIYTKNLDAAPSGIGSNYTKVRKLEIVDTSGGTNFWDIQVSQTGAASSRMYIRDNAGATVLQLNRVLASATVNTGAIDLHWKPSTNNTWDLGDGTTPLRWRKLWVVDTDISGTDGIGSGGLRFSGGNLQWSHDRSSWNNFVNNSSSGASGLIQFSNGSGGFGSDTSFSWSTANIRLTIAGIGGTQAINVSSGYIESAGGVRVSGTSRIDSSGNINGATIQVGGTTIFNSSRQWDTSSGSLNPSGSASVSLGGVSNYWLNLYISSTLVHNGTTRLDSSGNGNLNALQIGGTTTINSSRQWASGDLIASSSSYVFGSSGTRWSKAWLTDLDVSSSGSITGYVGSGNWYNRTFSGGDANCSGVTNGWTGIRTDTNELQVCIGGAVKKVSLT